MTDPIKTQLATAIKKLPMCDLTFPAIQAAVPDADKAAIIAYLSDFGINPLDNTADKWRLALMKIIDEVGLTNLNLAKIYDLLPNHCAELTINNHLFRNKIDIQADKKAIFMANLRQIRIDYMDARTDIAIARLMATTPIANPRKLHPTPINIERMRKYLAEMGGRTRSKAG